MLGSLRTSIHPSLSTKNKTGHEDIDSSIMVDKNKTGHEDIDSSVIVDKNKTGHEDIDSSIMVDKNKTGHEDIDSSVTVDLTSISSLQKMLPINQQALHQSHAI